MRRLIQAIRLGIRHSHVSESGLLALTVLIGGGVAGCSRVDAERETVSNVEQALDQTNVFTIPFPSGKQIGEFAILANSTLNLNGSARVTNLSTGFAAVANLGTTSTVVGIDGATGNVTSISPVRLLDRSRVNGSVITSQAVTLSSGAMITGTKTEHATIGKDVRKLSVVFPGTTQGNVTLTSGQNRTLQPGAFGALSISSSATLELKPGAYTFESATLESGSKLLIDDAGGPAFIFVRTGFTFRGLIQSKRGVQPDVLFAVAGTTTVVVQTAFNGTLLAPSAAISLGSATPGHTGSFIGKSVDVAAGTTVRFSPFNFWNRIADVDFDQDGVADGLDNCPSLANPGQADADSDGLGDACDSCPSGTDQDKDGICDAVDNCPTAFNPNQRDTDNDGVGNICDDQRCFTTLEAGEIQRAAQLALADSRASALRNNRHYTIVNSDAACKTRGPTAQRRVKVGLYDYGAEQGYRALVNLTTSTVEQLTTSSIRMQATPAEVATAIAVANQSPQIAPQFANFEPTLTSAEVGTMSGTECANKRCLGVVYVRRGGDATVTPPEGYIPSVRWKGFNSGPTVFVTAADSRVITVLP